LRRPRPGRCGLLAVECRRRSAQTSACGARVAPMLAGREATPSTAWTSPGGRLPHVRETAALPRPPVSRMTRYPRRFGVQTTGDIGYRESVGRAARVADPLPPTDVLGQPIKARRLPRPGPGVLHCPWRPRHEHRHERGRRVGRLRSTARPWRRRASPSECPGCRPAATQIDVFVIPGRFPSTAILDDHRTHMTRPRHAAPPYCFADGNAAIVDAAHSVCGVSR
jgi:hypothetical protein